ncbi:hypothetical protein ABIA14_001378 [Sinorhizobium fredii]|uniref:DUF2865 domain-containing protein n=2 Tax=Rhizobium fredii TaxID=380 RepID=A0A844A8B7_RHIFR|nr:DUF2865 domain-containing protein [Sinorhizobium fredii]MQX08272.1 DUF2865 domain-containing protein [Sinorhizobium fredii]UTY49453.1 DUF2865 domain-containing protein [Sinorhizobium fredii]
MSVFRPTASRRMMRYAAALLPLALGMTAQASATGVCERLSARLAQLPAAFTTTANLRDFTGAVSRQNIEIRRAKNERRRMTCSNDSVVYIDSENEAACAELDDAIVRMEHNLRTLKAQRQHLISKGNDDMRRRILAALELNGCSGEAGLNWDETIQDGSNLEEAHVQRNILEDYPPDGEEYPLLFDGPPTDDFTFMENGPAGGFRTMCVRTCDGAFFPISSNATPADFARDTELCRARCPGADTELYYHVLATEESEQMVSASTGRPYTELPNAFAYRTHGVGAPGICGCQIPKVTADQDNSTASGTKLSVVSPSVVTIRGTDAPATAPSPAKPAEERPYDPATSKVRVVGPAFLPQEESAIDLKNPRGSRYQPLQNE